MADIYKVTAPAGLALRDIEHAVRAAERDLIGTKDPIGSGNLLRVDLLKDNTRVFLEATSSLAAKVADELGGQDGGVTYEASNIDAVNAIP